MASKRPFQRRYQYRVLDFLGWKDSRLYRTRRRRNKHLLRVAQIFREIGFVEYRDFPSDSWRPFKEMTK
jgi:hypothetical protein